jgi:hypothetical protein
MKKAVRSTAAQLAASWRNHRLASAGTLNLIKGADQIGTLLSAMPG